MIAPLRSQAWLGRTVLHVADEHFASLQLVSYLPTPGTGTREKVGAAAAQRRRFDNFPTNENPVTLRAPAC